MITKEAFDKIMKGINYENLVGQLIHSIKMNPGCQFKLLEYRGTSCYCITPKTKKEYILNINEIYPTRRTRDRIISIHRDELIKAKVNTELKRIYGIK